MANDIIRQWIKDRRASLQADLQALEQLRSDVNGINYQPFARKVNGRPAGVVKVIKKRK